MEENNKQDQEPKDYNRLVCSFCPSKVPCEALRGKHHCGDCKSTILCAQTKGPGLIDCDIAQQKWKDADLRDLRGTCLLGKQIIEDPKLVIKVEEDSKHLIKAAGAVAKDAEGQATLCPRCGCLTASTEVSYAWTPGKPLRTHRKITCYVCCLDERGTFG